MRKRIVVSLILLAALLAGSVPALAQEPIEIYPQCDPEVCGVFTVPSDQPLVFVGWWGAATRGQVRVFLNHSEETLTLQRLVGDSKWALVWSLGPDDMHDAYGPITPIASDVWGLDCPMPMMHESMFQVFSEPLEAGTYSLEWVLRMSHPVNDGLHACTPIAGEGFPTPSLYRGEVVRFVNTIIVTE
jgi:hypothetical protein